MTSGSSSCAWTPSVADPHRQATQDGSAARRRTVVPKRLAWESTPGSGRRLAGAAVEDGRRFAPMLSTALLAARWVAPARRDREAASAYAREATAETHRRPARFEYAEALELEAMTTADPAASRGLLATGRGTARLHRRRSRAGGAGERRRRARPRRPLPAAGARTHPHDERAHLALVEALVRAGHHCEARRCYATYTARMSEIGVEPTGYPSGTPAPARA